MTVMAALGVAMPASAAVTEFGREGSDAGEFVSPTGIAVAQASGVVYIVDRNNQRTERFTEEGAFLSAWGWGVGDGRMEAAQVCTSTCFAGIAGEGTAQFSFPEGVALDNNLLSSSFGDAYVLDARNHRVEKFDAEGAFLLMFGRNVKVGGGDVCHAEEACQGGEGGEGEGQLEGRAGAIALTPSGSVVVGDVNRLELFAPGGVLESEVSIPEAGTITGVAIDSGGNIYLTAQGFTGVRKFDESGTPLGEPRDEAGTPGAIAVGPSDELYVNDTSNQVHHILEYGPEGVQLASFDARPAVVGTSAIAVRESNIYVLEPTQVRVVSPPEAGPLVVPGSTTASEQTPTSAQLDAAFNPEGNGAVEWHFEYGTSTSYGASTPVETSTGGEFEDQAAQAALSELQPRTEYHFRLVVTNGKGETRFGEDATFTTLPPVAVVRTFVTDVTSRSALLAAVLDPLGSAAEYHFEYGLTTAYEASSSLPTGKIAAGPGEVEVSLPIQALDPGALYHFRIRAHNMFGETVGPDQTFTTHAGVASPLLDGRAWEMVSPPEKHGVALEAIAAEGGLIQAADDGSALTYFSLAPIESGVEGNRSLANSQVLSLRSPSGWTSRDISVHHEKVTPLFPGDYSEYRAFSDSLHQAFIEPEGTTPLSSTATERTPYRRESDGSFLPLVNDGNVQPGVKWGGVETLPGFFVGGVQFVGGSSDGESAALISSQALTSELEDPKGLQNVYVWHAGTLRLASVMPDGKASSEEGMNAFLGKADNLVRGAVSQDGSRIVFMTSGAMEHIYLRDMNRNETVQVDAGEPGTPVPLESRAHYQGASSDGKRVFFLSSDRLTHDSTARPNKPDLYMCEATVGSEGLACRLEDLSTTKNAAEAAYVQGVVVGMDRAGKFVYFVADGKLTGQAPAGNCETTTSTVIPGPGVTCNLYVRDVEAKSTQLVATLAGRDQNDWAAVTGIDLGGVTARVSDDGRYATFMSQRSLTGFDNHDARSGALDEEVYLFDREQGALTCVSCARSGAQPTGIFDSGEYPGLLVDRPAFWTGMWLAASIPGWTRLDAVRALYPSRVLSNSGRMFFNSVTPLVAEDTNGKEDVYEFEPEHVGGCAQPNGCVGLVSSGESSEESAFLDASEDGDDVFFLTATKLWSSDTDRALDVYDAHVCSAASPCLTAPPVGELSCTTGPECRTPSGPPAPDVAPASEAPSGEGNIPGSAANATKPAAKGAKHLSRAQLLARALRSCKKLHKGKRRTACVRKAKRRYGSSAKRHNGSKRK